MCWVCWREFHLPFVNEIKRRLERWSISWTSVIPSLRESIKLGKIGWSCATDVCARMVDRWSIMDICLLWVRLKQDKDRSYGTIRLTGHSWARNSRQGVSMYRIQGTSRYIYIYCLGTVSIHDMYTACIWCVCHLHSSVEVSIIWNWQCADDRCIKPTRTRITYVSSLEMTCYWRQRYVMSRSDCSWRNYLMIVSLSYAC